jgi:hypothetical protein
MEQDISPDSSIDKIESRPCLMCEAHMVLARITPARLGFDLQTYKCVQCNHVERVLVATGLIQSKVLCWLFE